MLRCVFTNESAMLDITPVENIFICEYMPNAPDGYVKIYLYGLMQCRNPQLETEDIMLALDCDEATLTGAFSYWQSKGLVRIVGEGELSTVRYLSPRLAGMTRPIASAKYSDLVNNLTALFEPRLLSTNELRHVYDWIEVFGISAEAVYELCKSCIAQKGKRVSINYLEAVAKSWADRGISTLEQAQDNIEMVGEAESGAKKLLSRWKIARRPTVDETALYEKWTRGWGFTHESIVSVCMSMTFAANPSFKALDTILDNYRQKGAITPEEIDTIMKRDDVRKEFIRMVFSRASIQSSPRASQREQISRFLDVWNMDPELVLYAADVSRGSPTPFANIVKLVTGWHDKGITKDLEAAKKNHEASTVAPQKKRSGTASQFKTRTYTDEELNRIGVSFLDD